MSGPEIESRQSLEESSQLGAKAEADDRTISEASKESILGAEDRTSTAHEGKPINEPKEKGRMVVIAGEFENCIPGEYEPQPFE